ncbi:alpha/beta hydrolase family protein [Streptomyces sp. NPDC085946]|uniref:alpha/beta hydrolase family protein n=1 Tax=Streptomyces sp. NPDC085946 TaxID=3365744 RepID=UPI0037CFC011
MKTSSMVSLVTAVALAAPVTASVAHARDTTGRQVSVAAPAERTATGVLLPRPGGHAPVGRSTLHLVDRSRQDLWVPERPRELMVDMYYPARSAAGVPAPYMDAREARLLVEAAGAQDAGAAAKLGATRTHSVAEAGPKPGRHPLLLLSPGFGAPRSTLTTLAEDLAGRGYVVALVDHAHESSGTLFPGDRMLTCVACEKAQTSEDMRKATVNRAQDLSFVLDRLTGRRPAWRHASLIDRSRIGAAGHSLGGAAAASLMARDSRVRAGVNMDGAFGDPVPEKGLGKRPFMMLGTDGPVHGPGGEDPTWEAAWQNLDGWKRWLAVTGAHHFTFSDLPVLFDQLNLSYPDTPPTIPVGRAVTVTRAYTAAFFDLHLRHRPQPLLAGPTADNPEVRFVHSGR